MREFQTKGETFGDDYLFAGPCLRAVDFAGAWEPPPGDPPVLLVSLGTSANRHPGFFRHCAEAFTGTPWHIVMTLGRDADPAELGTLPPNVEVRSWLPHLTVLGHAAAFVCQGGTGSLMEAFHQGVPVVVVPQQQDQWATARQVVDLGLGRSISPGDLDAETLRTAVEAIADDAGMRHRVRELSRMGAHRPRGHRGRRPPGSRHGGPRRRTELTPRRERPLGHWSPGAAPAVTAPSPPSPPGPARPAGTRARPPPARRGPAGYGPPRDRPRRDPRCTR